MEPVEINAGAWYLRALRHDTRVTDVPALRETGLLWAGGGHDDDTIVAFIRACETGWTDESRLSWAVCEPTTGELVALIAVVRSALPESDTATIWTAHRAGRSEALDVGRAAVVRFATAALDVRIGPHA